MIKIENLKFKYPSSKDDVLDVPRFFLKRGERVFLFGPSGSGKTTFLEVLAGINIPYEGTLEVGGEIISKMSSAERDRLRADHMGYIFQSFNLIPYLSVIENITLPLYLSQRKRKQVSLDQEKEKGREICQFLGLEKFLNNSVTELSVGQQQRVAAARAVIGNPEIILADEPTSSLDYDQREKFIMLLFDLCERQQTSVLFVSHDRSLEKMFHRSLSLQEINKATVI